MNGTEFEANWFSHQFQRHITNCDLRRELAMTRAVEKQQQLKISLLKPKNESILEHTISYEQLAVDLTAELAKRELDCNVKTALDFALLEDFDHLYRYANLLEMEQGIYAEWLVGRYTEIMPGRPTISEHRCPIDNVKRNINSKCADVMTVLSTMIITAAEQQTMNYYMNIANIHKSEMGRKLYSEIAMIEEQHVTEYGSLLDTNCTWLENWVMHEYTECYLYYSCYQDESDPRIKKIWLEHFEQELTHLKIASEMLKKYEGREWEQLFVGGADFPSLIKLKSNINYVREVMNTVRNSAYRETTIKLDDLPDSADYFKYQRKVNSTIGQVASHNVIEKYIKKNGQDYRFEVKPNPEKVLRDRKTDNTDLGRKKGV